MAPSMKIRPYLKDSIWKHNKLKPLYMRAEVECVGINKILVDCGACINVIPHSLLGKIGKYDTYLKPNKTILSNYEGNACKPLGVIQVGVVVGTTIRPNLFVVILTKVNYNLLLGREWLYGSRLCFK